MSLALALGGPQLLVYVIGLPTLVLFFLRRNRARESTDGSTEPGAAAGTTADEANANNTVGVFDGYEASEARHGQGLFGNPVVMTRWGLFFKGYVS